MKKFMSEIALMVLLISGTDTFAQYQSYFGEEQTSWKLKNTFITPETGSIDSLAYVSDTLYLGHTYKRYGLWSYVVSADLDPNSIWYQGGDYFIADIQVWLRESSGADSLFMVLQYGNNLAPDPPELICVMGLDLGDNFMGMPVINVDTDAAGRKVIDIDMGFYTERFVEGVGPLGFFSPNDWSEIICQVKDDEVNYLTDDEIYAPFCLGNPLSASALTASIPVLSAFPNPFDGQLNLEHSLAGEGTYTLYDLLGRVVMQGWLTPKSLRLSTAHLPKGIYLLKADAGQWQAVLKLVKS
jgi:hypothetical protein